MIRTHPKVLDTGALVNVEADSLNATVLGPDVEDETYDAFIRDVHREMTQKVVRSVRRRGDFVPADRIDEVIEDLGEKLATTRVGDPSIDGVHMGPLSSMAQKSCFRRARTSSVTRAIVYGHPTEGSLVGADPNRGAFILPTLIRTEDSARMLVQCRGLRTGGVGDWL